MAGFISLCDAAQVLTGDGDDETFDFWLALLARQVEDGALHGVDPGDRENRLLLCRTWRDKRRVVMDWQIPVVAFDAWRAQHGYVGDATAPALTSPTSPEKEGRRQQQIAAILAAVHSLDYDPLNVPRGGKGKITDACLGDARLFSSVDAFEHAWRVASAQGKVRVENYEMYARGK
ncbi:MAG: hypothetical protein EPN31_13880 [Castellaniella sp.]|uniref:hypothetical protein n=1 Tax=Castellaniella sp. TaxID=1955812 RepID=UPI001207607A|nr:hypothetical protein [Castellaniella sp.]TAN26009.1 MAG: hypothetical protein EPN31_13880 [Castellaniella sp.]